MKKYLIIFLILFFNIKPLYRMFSQNCPYIGPDIQLPCGVNSTQLTADFSQCTGGGSSPLATTTYLNSQIPYVAQTNTGTSLTMTDDSQQGPFNIGFSFCFYGNTYTQFYVGSNGWISFSPNQPTSYTSATVPNASNPVNSVMAAWQDWHPGLGGQVRYQLQGTAPCRKLVVSWINVPFYNCTTVTGTFHIVLYESTNVVEVHTQNKQFCSWANGTAVQGIQNSNGTQAVTTPGRNSTQWTAQNDGRRWTPNGAPVTATPTWYQVGNPVAIGTGLTITVTPPPVGAYYTCRMEYPSCFAGWSSCNNSPGSSGPDTIFVVPGPPSLPQPQVQINNPSCATLCDGSIIVTPVGGLSPYIFTWLTGQSGPNINNLCQGSYQVQISDAQGCSVISNPIQLIDPPVPTLTPIVSSDTVCSYSTSQLFSVVNTTGWNYQWSSDGTILSGNGTSQIDVDFSQLLPNSQYTTSVAGFNQNGCPTPIVSYSTFLYQVIPQITPIGPFCDYDDCQTLTAIPLGGQFSGSSVVNSEFCPQLSQTQTNLVTYDFIQSGCQFSDVVSILVNQRPIIEEVNPDNGVFEICDGVDSAIVTLQVVSNPSSTANYWIINSDTVESNSLLGNFAEGVTYISVISEINGCLSLPETTSVNVIRCPQTIYYVPNSFTPDGDEHNQTFGVVFTSGFNPTEFQIQIFNRWGELIWESYDHQFKWDGTYDGRVVQAGIYTWKIKFGNADDDGFNLISGHLNILR